jgi:hypothetical protein
MPSDTPDMLQQDHTPEVRATGSIGAQGRTHLPSCFRMWSTMRTVPRSAAQQAYAQEGTCAAQPWQWPVCVQEHKDQ